jgi:hypothetical protein
MTTDVHESPPGEPPPPEKQNVFSRIAGVLFAPAETFSAIARRPDILGPLLLIIILGYLSTFAVMRNFDVAAATSSQIEQMRSQNPNMTDEDVARVERFSGATMKVMGWVSPLLGLIWYAIVAGVLLLACRLFGGEGTYKQAFSATLYAWMPLVLFSIIFTIVVTARGSFDPMSAATLVKSNPAFLVDMKTQPVLFALLSSLDIFTVWTIALLSIGFSKLSKSSIGKTATIVVSLWFAMILVKVGFAALGAARMKG